MQRSTTMKRHFVFLLILVLSGCLQKQFEEMPKEEKDENFVIDVPQNFDWSNIDSRGIQINLLHNNQITYALDSTLLELYDEDDELLDALVIYDGQAEFNIRVPASSSMLKIKSVAVNVVKEFEPTTLDVNLEIPDISAFNFQRIDTDSDGLYDFLDIAPFNDEISVTINQENINNNLKSATGKSKSTATYTIFEDLWPSKGDYDFNDLVVNTSFSWERGKGNYVTEIEGVCDIENIGAGMSLGLGFELFESKGTNLYYLDDVIAGLEGAEKDPKVTNGFIVFSKVQELGTSRVQFVIKLKNRAFKSFLCIPYLFRTKEPDHQVRPFGAPPTQGQNMSLFRSGDDVSPAKWSWGKGSKFKYPLSTKEAFYRTRENHPWGIEFMSKKKFKPTPERRTIVKGYPKFRAWAESGGNKEKNWYEHPE